jgi:hypothetical protein
MAASPSSSSKTTRPPRLPGVLAALGFPRSPRRRFSMTASFKRATSKPGAFCPRPALGAAHLPGSELTPSTHTRPSSEGPALPIALHVATSNTQGSPMLARTSSNLLTHSARRLSGLPLRCSALLLGATAALGLVAVPTIAQASPLRALATSSRARRYLLHSHLEGDQS